MGLQPGLGWKFWPVGFFWAYLWTVAYVSGVSMSVYQLFCWYWLCSAFSWLLNSGGSQPLCNVYYIRLRRHVLQTKTKIGLNWNCFGLAWGIASTGYFSFSCTYSCWHFCAYVKVVPGNRVTQKEILMFLAIFYFQGAWLVGMGLFVWDQLYRLEGLNLGLRNVSFSFLYTNVTLIWVRQGKI